MRHASALPCAQHLRALEFFLAKHLDTKIAVADVLILPVSSLARSYGPSFVHEPFTTLATLHSLATHLSNGLANQATWLL